MDAGVGTDAEVTDAYRQLEWVNLWLGGYRASLDPLREMVRDLTPESRPLSLLDVAGGDGRFAARLLERLSSPAAPATAWVLDLSRVPTALAAARRPPRGRLVALRGDARRLPFPDRAVDVAHTAAFFHHLGVDDARQVLAEMCRVSRRLVLINDLVRSWVAAASIWVLAGVGSRNRLIRHDGRLSVLKSFRPPELLALARAAGPPGSGFRWRLVRTFPYRMSLLGVRTDAPPSGETRLHEAYPQKKRGP